MALIQCPECSLSISDKAAACPNCGYPLHPAPEPVEYKLSMPTFSESKGAKFLRAVAWLVWIGGLILAIATSIVEKTVGTYYSYTERAFDWGIFFTALCTYALYGGLIWSVALLFEDVHDISSVLMSLRLQKTSVDVESSVSKPIAAKPSVLFGSYPQGNADGSASPIEWLTIATKDDQSLLMSRNILAFQSYDTSRLYSLWEQASIRRWLNEDFYAKALSEDEKQNILPTQLSSTNGSSKADNVFLLSIDEAQTYLDDQTLKTGNWWWLRNSDSNTHTVAYVDSEGYIHTGFEVEGLTKTGGVRPCIWVKNKTV